MAIPEPPIAAPAPELDGSWFHAGDWTAADLLPGLYVAALFLLLNALLRKCYDPVPGRIQLWFALVLLVLFAPALFGGRVLLPVDNLRISAPFDRLAPSHPGGWGLQVDLTLEIAPHQVQVRRLLRQGDWPLWNDSVGAGMPLLADPQAQAFQPLVLPGLPFAVETAAGISASLRVLVALTFFFLLLRRQGLAASAAFFGSTVFALSGCVMLWLGWPLANAAVLLPAVLYALARAIDLGGARDQLLLFGTLVALLCSGHPETALYALSLAAVFTGAKLWARRRTGAVARRCAGIAAVFLLAAAAAAPLLLPAREYLPTTERAAVLKVFDVPVASAFRDLPTADTLAVWGRRVQQRARTLVAARPFGDHEVYWGETNLIDDGAGFAGTIALLFAAASLFSPRDCAQERCLRWVLAGSLLLLWQPPGFDVLTYHLPLVDFTAAHKHRRLFMLVAFAVAYLGACGFDRWRRGGLPRRRLLMAALMLAAAIGAAYAANGNPSGPQPASAWQTAAAVAQAAALAAAVGALFAAPAIRARALLIAVAAVELLALHVPANLPNSRRLAYPEIPELQFLKAHLGDFRLSGIGPVLVPNIASVYGLRDIRIGNPSAPASYSAAIAGLRLRPQSPALGKPRHTFYDFLGVRYLAANPELELPLERVFQGPGAAVFERPTALRRMFLPGHGRVSGGAGWEAPNDPTFAYAQRAWFQTSPGHDRDWSTRARRAPRLRVRLMGATRTQARLNLPEERLLASSQFQDGSWHFVMDGRAHPGILANGQFAAAWIPRGRHVVDLLYRSRAFYSGLLLAAAAIAAGLVWWLPPPATTNVRPAPRLA